MVTACTGQTSSACDGGSWSAMHEVQDNKREKKSGRMQELASHQP